MEPSSDPVTFTEKTFPNTTTLALIPLWVPSKMASPKNEMFNVGEEKGHELAVSIPRQIYHEVQEKMKNDFLLRIKNYLLFNTSITPLSSHTCTMPI